MVVFWEMKSNRIKAPNMEPPENLLRFFKLVPNIKLMEVQQAGNEHSERTQRAKPSMEAVIRSGDVHGHRLPALRRHVNEIEHLLLRRGGGCIGCD